MGYFIWGMPNSKALGNAEQILAVYLKVIYELRRWVNS